MGTPTSPPPSSRPTMWPSPSSRTSQPSAPSRSMAQSGPTRPSASPSCTRPGPTPARPSTLQSTRSDMSQSACLTRLLTPLPMLDTTDTPDSTDSTATLVPPLWSLLLPPLWWPKILQFFSSYLKVISSGLCTLVCSERLSEAAQL